jgi:hypothetical protein
MQIVFMGALRRGMSNPTWPEEQRRGEGWAPTIWRRLAKNFKALLELTDDVYDVVAGDEDRGGYEKPQTHHLDGGEPINAGHD